MKLFLSLAVAAGLACAQTGQPGKSPLAEPARPGAEQAQPAFDKVQIESYVRHLNVWPAEIKVEVSDPRPAAQLPGFREVTVVASANGASQQQSFLLSPDGGRLILGTVYELGRDPFQENIDRLQLAGQPAFGPPLAPVTLVVFSDFQCSYCKQEAEVLRQHVAQTFPRDVRVVFHDFPLEQIHPWARAASVAGRCVYQQNPDKFWTYHDWVFANQQQLTVENVKQQTAGWAMANGVDAGKFQACVADAATNGTIDRLLAQGRALGVNATPTLVINGRKIPAALPWEQLQVVLREEANYQQKKSAACCALPAPGAKK